MVDLMQYQQQSLEIISKYTSFSGKKVLEIGGDMGGHVAIKLIELGAGDVWSINIDDTYFSRDIGNIHWRKVSAYQIEHHFESNSFDIVLGIAVLEHIGDTQRLSRAIRGVIEPGGVVYLQGGPFWTCCHGHHLVYFMDDRFYTFTGDNPIPDWLHLLQTEHEAVETLKDVGVLLSDVDAIVDQIYNGTHINRQRYSQIKQALYNSDLNLYYVEEHIRKRPDESTLSRLTKRGWSMSEPFGVYSADFVFLP